MRSVKKCLIVLLSLFSLYSIALANSGKITAIEISGTERLSKETVIAYLEFRLPMQYDQDKIDTAIRRLFETGLFADVDVKQVGSALHIAVAENPIVYRVAFEGTSSTDDEMMRKEISLLPRSIYSLAKLQNDIRKIVAIYRSKGYYSVKVDPQIVKLSQNRVDLVYKIKKGSKAKIMQINFVGNKEVSSAELESIILSKEYAWYRILNQFEKYEPDRLILDQELLRTHYMNLGFIDFHVISVTSELSQNRDSFIITFNLHEGDRYRINDIEVQSHIPGFDNTLLREKIKIEKGSIFKQASIENATDVLTKYFGEHGYAFVNVDYDLDRVDKNLSKFVNVKFNINKSKRIYINKINVFDNVITRDRVIRREFRISEGDPYNVSYINRSKQRVTNLGYFSMVDLSKSKTEYLDRVDIDVRVKEIETGSFRFALGYNSQTGPSLGVLASEYNFLGKGQILTFDFNYGTKTTDVSFGFAEPYFLGKELRTGFDVFANSLDLTDGSAYKDSKYGASFSATYALREYLAHSLGYTISKRQVNPAKDATSLIIQDAAGETIVSSINQSFIYNRLNSNIFPTSGYIIKLSQEFAGLGGDARYLKNQISGSTYWTLYRKGVILQLFAKAGNILGIGDKPIKLVDNYRIGKQQIRGFADYGIGPRDVARDKDGKMRLDANGNPVYTDALGGKYFYYATAEVTFPLGFPEEVGIRGAIFFDAGDSWGVDVACKSSDDSSNDLCRQQYEQAKKLTDKSALRTSFGIGISWASPLGNIRLDYGIPISAQPFDQKERLRLTFGYGAM